MVTVGRTAPVSFRQKRLLRPRLGSRGQIHLLLIGLAVLATVVVGGRFHWDDAFITFRMARNIGHGLGWTYNAGYSQDAATGALWTLLLAGVAWMHVGVVGASEALTALFTAGASILVFETLDLFGARRAGILAGMLLASSEFLALNNGMELPIALFFISLAGYLAQRGRLAASGVACALGILTRGDVLLFVAVLGVGLLFKWKREIWRFVGGIIMILIPWSSIAVLFIGHLLPDTLQAKMDQGRSGFWSGSASYFGFVTHLPTSSPTGGGHSEVWFAAIVVLSLVGLGAVVIRERLRPMLVAAVFAALYVITYGLVLRVPAYPWYYTMPVFVLIVLSGVGLDITGNIVSRSHNRLNLVAPFTAVALSAVSLSGAPATIPRLATYASADQWLNLHASPDATLAAAEIGVVGWHSPNRIIIDYLGLTSTEAAQKLRQRDLLWWVYAYHPDYWLTLGFPVDQQLLRAPWFNSSFKPVWSDHLGVLFERTGPIPPQV